MHVNRPDAAAAAVRSAGAESSATHCARTRRISPARIASRTRRGEKPCSAASDRWAIPPRAASHAVSSIDQGCGVGSPGNVAENTIGGEPGAGPGCAGGARAATSAACADFCGLRAPSWPQELTMAAEVARGSRLKRRQGRVAGGAGSGQRQGTGGRGQERGQERAGRNSAGAGDRGDDGAGTESWALGSIEAWIRCCSSSGGGSRPSRPEGSRREGSGCGGGA